jgi:transcription termination/antitermination protein NusG
MTKKATTKKSNGAAKATSTLEERADAILERGATAEREGKKGRRVASVAANETEDDAPPALTPEAEAGEKPVRKWYAVTVYSGYENKVKVALQERIRQHHMEDKFGEILIPSETVSAVGKDGKARVRAKTTFPGYLFVEMEMGENAWHVVKDTPKVTGFVGNQRPQEVKPPHIEDLRKGITEGTVKPKPRQQFQEGDEVRVVVGAFANFSGTVQEVKPDKQKLKVMVSIFGRPTPVELDFGHVEKR